MAKNTYKNLIIIKKKIPEKNSHKKALKQIKKKKTY